MNIKHDLYLALAWREAHRGFDISPDWREFLAIRKEYQGSPAGRHYHTWQHIYETIRFVHLHYGSQPLVIMALFYHDVVYSPFAKDNEEKSADRWVEYAKRRGINRFALLRQNVVVDLIMVTKSHKMNKRTSLLFAMMIDADMHVFLCPDEHYLLYARDIWREYQDYGREQYLAGRLGFLEHLDPDTIFYTHQARQLVHHARANIDLEKTILTTDPSRLLN